MSECYFCGWEPDRGTHGCTPDERAEKFFADHPEPDDYDVREMLDEAQGP